MCTTGRVAAGDLGAVLPHEHLLCNTVREYRRTGLLHDVAVIGEELRAFAAVGGGTVVDVTPAEIAQGTAPDPAGALGPPGADGSAGVDGSTGVDGTAGVEGQPGMDGSPGSPGSPGATGAPVPAASPLPEVTWTRPPANVLALDRLARETGVNIVLGTGHYRDPYLDREWFDRHGADAIAELMVRDLESGFPGTEVKAGVIGEIGAEQWYVSAAEERSFRAAARAHLRTGVTVTTHAARWPVGLAQLDILTAEGVDPGRVVIGHCDMVPSPEYHLEVARRGAYVQFDTFHRCTEPRALRSRVDAIMRLVRAGFLERVLVSHDMFLADHLGTAGGPGLTYITERLPAALAAAGLDAGETEQILVANPQAALAS